MKLPESGRRSGRFYRPLLRADMLGVVLGALLLAACGQKGPLYLPDQPPPPSKPFSDCDAPSAPCRQSGAGNANSTTNSTNTSTINNSAIINNSTTPSVPAATTPAPVSSTATPESSSP